MELVPIVITALEIVSVLAVLTLIISYIAYRIRLKNAPEKEQKPDLEPNFAFRGLNKLTRLPKEIPSAPKNVAAPPKPQPQKPKEVRHVEKKPVKRNERQEPPRTRRLEVVKNLPVSEEPEQEIFRKESKSSPKNLNTLGDDIIGKYDDDENSELFNLKIDKKNSKK